MANLLTRRNIFGFDNVWNDTILWYARGVKAMRSKPLSNVTSWAFYAAIHGINRWLWDYYGFTQSNERNPPQGAIDTYWDQCQHQSWYFLPWHRGYLLALEKQIRTEIKALRGPADEWSLPYWNCFGKGQNVLPLEFQTPDWPDGNGDNPLFVVQRYGGLGGTNPFDIGTVTNLNSLGDPSFSGPGGGGATGFGGPETGFSWRGVSSGGLEMNPHNILHVLVGGEDRSQQFPAGTPFAGRYPPGVMSTPVTAALDPIFYLHHCNIDRLWESWNKFPPNKLSSGPTDWQNPSSSRWKKGPQSIGERTKFAMPSSNGNEWTFAPHEMESIVVLGYQYDDLEPGAAVQWVTQEMRAESLRDLGARRRAARVANPTRGEVRIIGAGRDEVSLIGGDVRTIIVSIRSEDRAMLIESLNGLGAAAPDRVFLNLENVTSLSDATIFNVFVGLPDDIDGAERSVYRAGAVSLFGVSSASDPSGRHAGSGLNFTLEISDIIDKLHVDGLLEAGLLRVQIASMDPISEASNTRIGRVSIYRQFE